MIPFSCQVQKYKKNVLLQNFSNFFFLSSIFFVTLHTLCKNNKMIIRNYEIGGLNGGLKAQKHLAQGIALGLVSELVRPARAKALI